MTIVQSFNMERLKLNVCVWVSWCVCGLSDDSYQVLPAQITALKMAGLHTRATVHWCFYIKKQEHNNLGVEQVCSKDQWLAVTDFIV